MLEIKKSHMAKKSTGCWKQGTSHQRHWGTHRKGHQKGNSEGIQGGCLADAGTGRPARSGEFAEPSLPLYQSTPTYSCDETEEAAKMGSLDNKEQWESPGTQQTVWGS